MIARGSVTPLATVIIPTKNRREELLRTIAAVQEQTLAVELLIMDDGSTDGSAAAVRSEFPWASLHRTEKSHGPTFQRNRAALLANTPIMFTIDDDCTLQSRRTLEQTVALFDQPQIGAVTIPFINVKHDAIVRSSTPAADKTYVACDYFGGMVAFRRDVFLEIGGYRPSYFMHVEESDLAVRMLNFGYVVRPGLADAIHHQESPRRDVTQLHRLGARNHVLFSWYNVPWPYLPFHLTATILLLLKHGLRIRHPRLILKGLMQGMVEAFREKKQRQPVSCPIYRLSRRLKKYGPLLLADIESELPIPGRCLPTGMRVRSNPFDLRTASRLENR